MSDELILTPAQIDFLTRECSGFAPGNGIELAGHAGSQRHFIRIHCGSCSRILIVWDSGDEDWHRFLAIGHDRERTGMLLPEIIAADPRHGLILEEDLGTQTLKRYCAGVSGDHRNIETVYRRTLEALCFWQSPHVAAHPVIAARSMDIETFLWESSYFARHFVIDFCGCEALLGDAWENERTRLARRCAMLPKTAIHRDFQSENVMIIEEGVRFVDFQGARLGPPEYDVASLLYDPYVTCIDDGMCSNLHGYWNDRRGGGSEQVDSLYLCAVQRLMQALGAYGNLSLHHGKQWYRRYMLPGLERLSGVMRRFEDYPAIGKVVEGCREAAKV